MLQYEGEWEDNGFQKARQVIWLSLAWAIKMDMDLSILQ